MTLASFTRSAIVPDQLLPYVRAVSGLRSEALGDYLLHSDGENAVLVAFPPDRPTDADAMNAALVEILKKRGLKRVVTLAASRPANAPQNARVSEDSWWFLELPAKPGQKTRHLLRRAAREIVVKREPWNDELIPLAKALDQRKNLDDASRYIHSRLPAYLKACEDAELYVARNAAGKAVACAIADFSSLSTAFYMFAFRSAEAPPGSADLLLATIVSEAEKRGYAHVNLGLGIDDGVRFFKRKWGAKPALAHIETEWEIPKKSFFAKLFGKTS